MTWCDILKVESSPDDMCCANARAALLKVFRNYYRDLMRGVNPKDRAEAKEMSDDVIKMVVNLDCVGDRGLNSFLIEMTKVPNSEWFKDKDWLKMQPEVKKILLDWISSKRRYE